MPRSRVYKKSKVSSKEGKRNKTNRKKVSFTARKTVKIPTKVAFKTRNGKNIKFTAHVKKTKKKKVSFYATDR